MTEGKKLTNVEAADNWSDGYGLITYEQWEERVFLAARSYSVVKPLGRGRVQTKFYRTFPEAVLMCHHTQYSNLYVITASGRACVIPRKMFGHYMTVYNRETGQKLLLPPDPYANAGNAIRIHASPTKRAVKARVRIKD